MNITERIEKEIRIGILDILQMESPLTRSALARRVKAAADLDDIRTATDRLLADHLIVRAAGAGRGEVAFRLPVDDNASDAGNQPLVGRLNRRLAAELAAAGSWLTVDALTARIPGVTRDQVRDSICGRLFRYGPRADDGTLRFGLAEWTLPDQVPADVKPVMPRGHNLFAAVKALTEHDRPMTVSELADAMNASTANAGNCLSQAAKGGRWVKHFGTDGRNSFYGLAEWPERAPTYALWPTGALALDVAGGRFELTPTETGQLIKYLLGDTRRVHAPELA